MGALYHGSEIWLSGGACRNPRKVRKPCEGGEILRGSRDCWTIGPFAVYFLAVKVQEYAVGGSRVTLL